MGRNYRVGGRMKGVKVKGGILTERMKLVGGTDRGEETEGGDRLMERGSKAD